jgi:hypothetical protein
MSAPPRRDLAFATFAEVSRDVATLRERGYLAAGKWNLAQVCGHLAAWLKFPLDGFPKMGPVLTGIVWMLRNTVGKSAGRRILATGKMPSRGQTIRQTVPPADADEPKAVDELERMIDRFTAHQGEYHPSPLFGRLTRAECQRLHLIHCAHHLSFLAAKT